MPRFHEMVHGVYFDDLDMYGMLHNARHLLLFERTLGSFWQHLGFGALQGHPDRYHFVRANEVEYLAPVLSVGQVRVRVHIERLGRSSLTFRFRMMPMDEDREFAVARRVVVRVDPDTHRPTPWTQAFRDQLRPWLGEGSE